MDSFSLPYMGWKIQNVLNFDFKIKDRLYTFRNTPGAIKVGLQRFYHMYATRRMKPVTINLW